MPPPLRASASPREMPCGVMLQGPALIRCVCFLPERGDMTTLSNSTQRAVMALMLAAAVLTACGSGGKYAVDGDTGAAAPATTIDMSATPKAGDSTMGVAPATGSAAPAGTTDTTKKVPSPSAP